MSEVIRRIGLQVTEELFPAGRPVVFTDIETTGVSPPDDRLIELAALRIDPGVDEAQLLSTLVRVPGPVRATHIHGITNFHLAHAPRFAELCPWLQELFSGALMVAHNASFEERFFGAELEWLGGRWSCPHLCTLALARRLHPERSGRGAHSLKGLTGLYEVEAVGRAHSALGDVLTLAELYARMLAAHPEREALPGLLEACVREPSPTPLWPDPDKRPIVLRDRGLADAIGTGLQARGLDGNAWTVEQFEALEMEDAEPAEPAEPARLVAVPDSSGEPRSRKRLGANLIILALILLLIAVLCIAAG